MMGVLDWELWVSSIWGEKKMGVLDWGRVSNVRPDPMVGGKENPRHLRWRGWGFCVVAPGGR